MSSPIKNFKTAVNVLPLPEDSFVPINNLIAIFSPQDKVQPRLSYTPDAKMVEFSFTGDIPHILQPMIQYFVNCDVPQRELQNLERICRQINPNKLGFFLRQEDLASSIGWTIQGPLSFATIKNRLPPGPLRTRIHTWSDIHKIDTLRQYSRIVGPGAQWEELSMSIPSIEIGRSLFDTMKVVLPPEPLLEEIEQASPDELGITIWLSSTSNLIRLALHVVNPGLRLTLAARLGLQTIPESNLAIVEGLLQAKSPSWLELGQVAAGRDCIIGYQ